MRIEVLGPVRLSTGAGAPVEVHERQLRLLLASLVVANGEPISADALIDRLWDRNLPANPKKVLHAKISRLRTTLDKARPGARQLLIHTPAGYCLGPEAGGLDAAVFKNEVERARQMSASQPRAEALVEALALWRGTPFGDVADAIWLQPGITELHEVRGDALEALIETHLEQGDPQHALGGASGFLEDYPMRERLLRSVMLALYQVGRQHEALQVFDGLRRRLAEDIGIDPAPETRELHGRILRQDPGLVPTPGHRRAAAVRVASSNVPAETGPLIGRERECAQIKALVTHARLVTLTGTGGVGKTRLAMHVAQQEPIVSEYDTWFIDLTELPRSSPSHLDLRERIASLAAAVLGLPEHPGTTIDQVCEALRHQRALLVLDNCEHVLAEAAAFAADVLGRARGVRVLATSREPLALPGEQCYDIGTLSTEPGENGQVAEAVAFFTARARGSDPGFLPDDDAEAVTELCRRLDGLPLALELAAARIRGLPVRDLLERLDDRLSILRRTGHAIPPRQQTLRGTIDWSWSLLDDHERAVLRRLAVHFYTTMDLEAAEAVCSDTDENPHGTTVARAEVLGTLLRLVDRSLVTTVSTPTGVRYGLLESIAAYAGEQLDAAGERQATAARHLRHYCGLAQHADDGLRTRQQRHWLARLAVEHTQLRHAFDEAVRRQDGASAATLTLAAFWHQVCMPGFTIQPWVGLHTELGRNLTTVLSIANLSTDNYAAVATLTAAMITDPTEAANGTDEALDAFATDTVMKARVQGFAGAALLSAGLRGTGERHLDQALASLAAHGQDWDLSLLACRRDWLLITLWREPPRGLPDGREVHEVLREIDDGYARLSALAVEHRSAELVSDHGRSAGAVSAALEMAQELRIGSESSLWLVATAIVAIREGNLDEALEELTQARVISGEIGFTVGAAYADFAESMIARHRDDALRARRLLDRWRAFTRAASAELLTEFEQGFLAADEGDLTAALAAFDLLVASIPQPGITGTTARMLELAAAIRVLDDDPREAAGLLGTAEAARMRTRAKPCVSEGRDIRRTRDRICATLSESEVSEAIGRGRELDPVEQLRVVAQRDLPHSVA